MATIKLMRPDRRKEASLWLNTFAREGASQFGEAGVIDAIFERIGVRNKWCVEFGAWDGKTFSNTYELITRDGWSSVQIEANVERFAELKALHASRRNVVCLNEFVGFDPTVDSIEFMLRKARCPLDLDFISIDIDGNDYHIWNSMRRYRPRLVVIEFNNAISGDVLYIQDRDPNIFQGCSLRALVELGKRRGYELATVMRGNAFFVQAEDFPALGIEDNSVDAMFLSARDARMFLLYDGTIANVGLPEVWLRQGDPKKRAIGPLDFQVYSEEERFFGDIPPRPE